MSSDDASSSQGPDRLDIVQSIFMNPDIKPTFEDPFRTNDGQIVMQGVRPFCAIVNLWGDTMPGKPRTQLVNDPGPHPDPTAVMNMPPYVYPSQSYVGGQTRKSIVKQADILTIGVTYPSVNNVNDTTPIRKVPYR